MKLNIYAIYDTAAAVYMKFWPALTDAVAMRQFTDLAEKQDNDVGHHPEHFYLCRVGSWNDHDAKLQPETPETLLTGLEAQALNIQQCNLNNGEE